jgi:hypothetical protein
MNLNNIHIVDLFINFIGQFNNFNYSAQSNSAVSKNPGYVMTEKKQSYQMMYEWRAVFEGKMLTQKTCTKRA